MTLRELLKKHEATIIANATGTIEWPCTCDPSVGYCPCPACAETQLYKDLFAELSAANDQASLEPGHLALPGETEYAVIRRRRSGYGAQQMDFALPVARIEDLSPADKRDLADTADAMTGRIHELCGEARL